MLKRNNVQILMVILIVATIFFLSFRQFSSSKESEIVTVFDGLVFLKNPPNDHKSKLAWWTHNKNILRDKYHLIPDDDFFTIPIMDFGNGYEKFPHSNFISGVSEDDYICDETIKDEKRCIKKESVFSIAGDLKNKIFIDVGGEIYIQKPDGKTKRIEKR